MMDWLKQLDPVWLFTFTLQAASGMCLIFFAGETSDHELGKLLLASAFGQSISSGQKVSNAR